MDGGEIKFPLKTNEQKGGKGDLGTRHAPMISAPGKQKQEDHCKFKVSVVYTVSSRSARTAQRYSISTTTKSEEKTVAKHGSTHL